MAAATTTTATSAFPTPGQRRRSGYLTDMTHAVVGTQRAETKSMRLVSPTGTARLRHRRDTRCSAAAFAGGDAGATTAGVFMDIEINGEPAGRLEFALRSDLAPKTVENFATLASGSRAGVTPSLTYKGCAFDGHSGKYSYTCK